jgi:hypothetical protein
VGGSSAAEQIPERGAVEFKLVCSSFCWLLQRYIIVEISPGKEERKN